MTKSYIWSLFNRLSHIGMILFFAICYLLADFDELLSYHVAFGLSFGILVLFRIIWGLIGPKYSTFKDFNFNIADLKEYLLSPFEKTKESIGHNPASSYAIVAIFILSFISIFTGLLTYGIEENHGVFSFLHSDYFKEMELFKELHELSSNLLLALIGVHIAGSLIDKFVKKNDAIDSMIDGYKKTTHKETITLNLFQKIFGLLWIIGTLFALYYLIFTKDNVFIASANVKQDYQALHSDFVKECGSCHITYPPYLLPKESWKTMMANLEDHFGDDASIDDVTNQSILRFLEDNSAQYATNKTSLKILESLKEDNNTIAITKTPYWIRKHREIDKEIFTSSLVKSKANCKACHQDIEHGLIEKELIKIPKERVK